MSLLAHKHISERERNYRAAAIAAEASSLKSDSGEAMMPNSFRAVLRRACAIVLALLPAAPAAAQESVLGGLYGGVALNYTIHKADAVRDGVRMGDGTSQGIGATAILGWSVPVSSRFYIGLDGDFSWDDRAVSIAGTRYILSHWGTLRGRVGYALSPSLLVFASAGPALADFDYKEFLPGGEARGSEHIWGYAVSAGAELAIPGGIRVRGEYMYSSFETWGFSTPVRHYEDSQAHILRLGAVTKLY